MEILNFPEFCDGLQKNLAFPYIGARISTLGGVDRTSVLLTVAKYPKEQWPFGYLENSTYARFHIDSKGRVEHFSGHGFKKVRTFTAKTFDVLLNKINEIETA